MSTDGIRDRAVLVRLSEKEDRELARLAKRYRSSRSQVVRIALAELAAKKVVA